MDPKEQLQSLEREIDQVGPDALDAYWKALLARDLFHDTTIKEKIIDATAILRAMDTDRETSHH